MQVINVPIFNDDGSVKCELSLSGPELKEVLQFGLNMAVASGVAQHIGLLLDGDEDEEFDD